MSTSSVVQRAEDKKSLTWNEDFALLVRIIIQLKIMNAQIYNIITHIESDFLTLSEYACHDHKCPSSCSRLSH